MLGLVFAAWEAYIARRFGSSVLMAYRKTVKDMVEPTPLAHRLYSDEALQQGLLVVSQLTSLTPDRLLREFGRHYINYGLTRHMCSYLLSQTHCARDLVLLMRQAHVQLMVGPDGLTPPVFTYEFVGEDRNTVVITYESPRHFCYWLWGAIEGAADRFGESVTVIERSCTRRGAPHCRFEVHFSPAGAAQIQQTPEQQARWQAQQQLASLVLAALPDNEQESLTLFALQERMRGMSATSQQLRPGILLEVLQMLRYAGLIGTTANRPGDTLQNRRYWRLPVASAPPP